ncbi:hypothetical protein Gotri_006137 [Gossypium trilobum]|uniref:Uncharacterized protein n=1 Tax=Gossypium trilobum TaxID=34281 RepID=A0A7J9EYX5_9ROSI|nr:hypothetical protein [Gossypium trilobum]
MEPDSTDEEISRVKTLEYNEWWVRRINDNIPKPSQRSVSQ